MNNGETYSRDVDALRQDLASLRSNVEQLILGLREQGTESAKRAVRAAEGTIKDRPLIAVLVVFLVGLVLGRFVMRR